MKRILLPLVLLLLAVLACGSGQPGVIPTLHSSPYDLGRTVYGFFPSPPEASTQSVVDTYQAISQHADVVLLQQNISWNDFVTSAEAESKNINDIRNQYILAHQNGLEVIFVVDPLNGLNRREFQGLPDGWEASFANPQVRSAFTNFTLRIVREFQPRYLGLASEINTYADAYPDDFTYDYSLYNETYGLVKAEAPGSQVFVFPSGADIPANYYSLLLARTSRPLAVAESGFSSEPAGPFPGDPQSQVDYLNAIHSQIGGERLAFWIYLLINDFDLDSYAQALNQNGQGSDVSTLEFFAHVGLTESDRTPKPALAVWDSFR